MHEGVLHMRDVQGPKKEGSNNARLAIVEHEIFKCQGIMERGLSANHSMIMDFIHEHKMDNAEIVEMILKLYDKFQDLQAQIFDLQNQNHEYEFHFKSMSIAASFSIP
ncbi:40s ribosomal protein s5-1 [Hordeum vulgare]|nr:40s ribosomal protein s5-1 [Hordeum vulgare]